MKKKAASLLLVPVRNVGKRNGKPNACLAPMPVSIEVLSRHLHQSNGVSGVPFSETGAFRTCLGAAVIGDCLDLLRRRRATLLIW